MRALAKQAETSWVQIASGGAEVLCMVQAVTALATPTGLAFTRALYAAGGSSELAHTVTAVMDLRIEMMRARLATAHESEAYASIDPYLFTELVGAPVQMYEMHGHMLPAGQDVAEAFYRIIDAAYERRSVAVISNIHLSGFDSIMPKTLATATCTTHTSSRPRATHTASPKPLPER
ncbi:hypothetical protein NQU54_42735 [Streptomyces samsunensis]|uniref:Uncharacterized protein n=1 Tax=Streptomyces malaysiensis subsp. samsunensis TaxID=459658 RepID=A0A9X2RYP5_STRMQ|nr:hypothetical protein [Streptomyces samsunensis]MCQ8835557.1 hypothetical protein [Streptomyces samsunensis]